MLETKNNTISKDQSFTKLYRDLPDDKYNDKYLGKAIRILMKNGHKEKAKNLFYPALEHVAHTHKIDPRKLFLTCIDNVKSTHNFLKIKLGAATREAPFLISEEKQRNKGIHRIIKSVRTIHKSKKIDTLSAIKEELNNAFLKKGVSFSEKESYDKKILENSIYSHLSFSRKNGNKSLQRVKS